MHNMVTVSDARQSSQGNFVCVDPAYQAGIDRCCAVKHQLPLDITLEPDIDKGRTVELKLYHMKQTNACARRTGHGVCSNSHQSQENTCQSFLGACLAGSCRGVMGLLGEAEALSMGVKGTVA